MEVEVRAETIEKLKRWAERVVFGFLAIGAGLIAAWLGVSGFLALRDAFTTPLGQLTLGDLFAGFGMGLAALVLAVAAMVVWDARVENAAK